MQLIDNVEQSKHNTASNRYLARANPDYRDWEITTLFYSAVHIVNNYLFLIMKKSPHGHRERKKLIKLGLNSIYNDYYSLEQLSWKARYEVVHKKLTAGEGDKAIRCHDAIINHVNKQLQEFGYGAAQMPRDDDSLERLR